jgi:hypothetical protein
MTAKRSKQPKPKAPVKPPEKDTDMDARGHKVGSRKGKVHAAFDEQDEATAFTLGQRLKLKDNTLRSWFLVWRRASKSTTKPAKAKVEAKPTKTTDNKPVEATVAAVH